jgi:hypothetical protein
MFSSKRNGQQQPSVSELLIALLDMSLESGEIFIIIDALGECKDRLELLKNVEEILELKMARLRMLTTSRRPWKGSSSR